MEAVKIESVMLDVMNCKYCQKLVPDDAIFCCYCGRKLIREKKAKTSRKRANGEGSVYEKNGKYVAVHTIFRSGIRITKSKTGFATKLEASQWLANSAVIEKPTDRVTFEELHNMWAKVHHARITKKKAQAYTAAFNTVKSIHKFYWDEITIPMLQDAMDCAYDSFNQKRTIKNMYHMMEDYANQLGLNLSEDKHKVQYLKLPNKVKPNKIPFEDWEVENIIKGWNAGDDFCGYILTMLYTGMRYGEMIDIRPENVHLDGLYLLAGKKTDAGREPINFTEELKPIIQKLFLDGKRYQYSDTTFKKHFKDCLKRNGCNDHLPHECRHTFATDMKNSKQNGMVIKDSMRHSSYTQTATYTHTSSEDIRKAIKESMPALVLTR